jgi:hypothetical protein
MCPKPDTILRARDFVYVFCNPVEMKTALDTVFSKPFYLDKDGVPSLGADINIPEEGGNGAPLSSSRKASDRPLQSFMVQVDPEFFCLWQHLSERWAQYFLPIHLAGLPSQADLPRH